jgi:hypothetical protein
LRAEFPALLRKAGRATASNFYAIQDIASGGPITSV